jgi:hypothetical protein
LTHSINCRFQNQTICSNKEFNTTLDLGSFGISRCLLEEFPFKETEKQEVEFMLNMKAQDINRRR